MCVFFFFKQKTAYEMRISDWSSDVCSSDLDVRVEQELLGHVGGGDARAGLALGIGFAACVHEEVDHAPGGVAERRCERPYGGGELRRCERGLRLRRQDRTSVVLGKRVSVSVDAGVGRILKKKNKYTHA